MDKQITLYTSIVVIAILLLITTMTDVLTNRLITKKMKKQAVVACLLIMGAMVGECIGVLRVTRGQVHSYPYLVTKWSLGHILIY